MNLSSSAAKGRAVLTRTWNRIRFWCSFPFARLGFWLRERKRYNAMFPRRWLSPAQIIDHDLELVDDDDIGKLDRSLLDLLVARRDHLKSSSGKFTILNISLFTFLVANYFHLGTDVSVYGISIKSSPGVAESLLAISSTLGIYAATLQANIAIVDGAIAPSQADFSSGYTQCYAVSFDSRDCPRKILSIEYTTSGVYRFSFGCFQIFRIFLFDVVDCSNSMRVRNKYASDEGNMDRVISWSLQ